MKKIIVYNLVFIIVLVLAACQPNDNVYAVSNLTDANISIQIDPFESYHKKFMDSVITSHFAVFPDKKANDHLNKEDVYKYLGSKSVKYNYDESLSLITFDLPQGMALVCLEQGARFFRNKSLKIISSNYTMLYNTNQLDTAFKLIESDFIGTDLYKITVK